jgi:hypothetical protein
MWFAGIFARGREIIFLIVKVIVKGKKTKNTSNKDPNYLCEFSI